MLVPVNGGLRLIWKGACVVKLPEVSPASPDWNWPSPVGARHRSRHKRPKGRSDLNAACSYAANLIRGR